MNKTSNLSHPASVTIKSKKKSAHKRKPTTRVAKNAPHKRLQKKQPDTFKQKLLLASLEILCLGVTAILAIMILLGYSANRFSGTNFLNNILPFAIGVLALILTACVFIIGWWKLRKWLQLHSELWTPILSFFLALLIALSITHDQFTLAYGNFRMLVGGKEEASRLTIAHQVYAAYRRHNTTQLQKMVDRGQEYSLAIEDAARTFGIDAHLLQGRGNGIIFHTEKQP